MPISLQINARTELALRYNDISPLENHHCAVAFEILEKVKQDGKCKLYKEHRDPKAVFGPGFLQSFPDIRLRSWSWVVKQSSTDKVFGIIYWQLVVLESTINFAVPAETTTASLFRRLGATSSEICLQISTNASGKESSSELVLLNLSARGHAPP